jgi:hypothetical protein
MFKTQKKSDRCYFGLAASSCATAGDSKMMRRIPILSHYLGLKTRGINTMLRSYLALGFNESAISMRRNFQSSSPFFGQFILLAPDPHLTLDELVQLPDRA